MAEETRAMMEVTVGLETTQIQVAVAWADILLGYAGFIVKYFFIPAMIGAVVGWMIGWIKHR